MPTPPYDDDEEESEPGIIDQARDLWEWLPPDSRAALKQVAKTVAAAGLAEVMRRAQEKKGGSRRPASAAPRPPGARAPGAPASRPPPPPPAPPPPSPPRARTDAELLGVTLDADEQEIRAARRRLVRELHPDSRPEHERATYTERMRAVNVAADRLLARLEQREQASGKGRW